MRNDNQAIDLLVAVIRQREHRPIVIAFTRTHLDASYDPIRARCRRNLDSIAIGALHLCRRSQIDRRRVEPHVHRFHGARSRND